MDKNTYTISDFGSAQVNVPVKPECPKLSSEVQPQVAAAFFVITLLKLGLEEDASKAAAILGYNFNSSEWYKKSYLLVSTNQTTLPKKDKSLLGGFKKILN